MREEILQMGREARTAAHQMAKVSNPRKQQALEHLAGALEKEREQIARANEKDIEAALRKGLPAPKVLER